MTEKLYYTNAYISRFEAKVISCDKKECGYDVVLDKTAFFPEEGGQYSDKGSLNGIPVIDVRESECVIHHITESALEAGASVVGILDFDERYEKMQCHTAEHILSGLFHSMFGLENVGFHLGADEVTMDISAPLKKEEIDEVERIANEVVYKNVGVTAEFPSKDELQGMEYRSKLDLKENVRIVRIGEYDACACCAPHVNKTGEIGIIKILDYAKLRGGMRLHITAGRRAYRAFSALYESARAVGSLLSAPYSEIASAVSKLVCDFNNINHEYSEYRMKQILNMADKLEKTQGSLVLLFEDAATDEMIAFSNRAVNKVSDMLVLLSGSDGNYKYVISSISVDLKSRIADINKSLLGRGGGKSNMVQGSFSANICDIKKYFNP